jgi:hypothetical protein
MHVRLGKAQVVTAIDDGRVSVAFRRDGSSQESHRVVLSVEVRPILSPPLNVPGETPKAQAK